MFENSNLCPEETLDYLRALSTDKRHFKDSNSEDSSVITAKDFASNSVTSDGGKFKIPAVKYI
jgi:hypothetical protein